MSDRKCSVEGCDRSVVAKSWCERHYRRWRANGTTEIVRRSKTEAFLRGLLEHEGAECVLWPFAVDRDGYGWAHVGGKTVHANRAMCIMAHGEPPFSNAHAAHECGTASCVNPRHLRWATVKSNMKDQTLHGTRIRGEKHPVTRLTEKQVLDIYNDPRSNPKIAADYAYSPESIARIRRGETWVHVTGHTRKA